MTPLPLTPGASELMAWRLDQAIHAPTWGSGERACCVGGRWNSKGNRAVSGITPILSYENVTLGEN